MNDWRAGARCATTDPDLFMPENAKQADAALSICGRCVVIDECRAWVATLEDPLGVIAGTHYGCTPMREVKRPKHSAILALVAEFTEKGESAGVIANRIGVNERTITRARAELAAI